MTDKPVVLLPCIHNAGCSLAARVPLDHFAQGRIDVQSSGSEPGGQLNSSVVAILVEPGLDPSLEFPKPLADETARSADAIVTMGCGDTCPVYPDKRYLEWDSKIQRESRSGWWVQSWRRSTAEPERCMLSWCHPARP